jgi:uncharacterized protein
MKQKKSITISDLKKLDKHIIANFVEDKTAEKNLEVNKDIYWVEGYLCALTSSSPFIKMDHWLPYINGKDCEFESDQHANEITSLILALKNDIAKKLNNQSYEPLYKKHNLKNESEMDLVTKWSKGYMFAAMTFNAALFQKNREMSEEVTTVLFPIMANAGIASDKEMKKFGISKKDIAKSIPMAVKVFDAMAEDIRKGQMPDARKPLEMIINDNDKIGRNDPCPCGSGKQYKKCCLDTGNTIH